ncbi:hypothetical protein R0137_04855 [Congregibacter brevis]|uniref:Uncharacterized protein n=1 Tax=Congregibacter brevis TaxID=3081201 RepID=A0ABZ0IFR3_9GAMM|nr:hypothetical protein R0137_04855 [Congregibacter sp. IMCC45268]
MMHSNGLHKIAAAGAVIVGAFLIMGAYGHFAAVLPLMSDAETLAAQLRLWVPGLILGSAGALSAAMVKMLWSGRRIALDVALGINTLAVLYFGYLLWKGVPGHPVGLFTGIVSCNLVLLLATRLGLIWPVINGGDTEQV